MFATLADPVFDPMAEKEDSTTVRIQKEMVRKMRVICAHTPHMKRQLKLSELLHQILSGPVDKMYDDVLRRIRAEDEPSAKRRKAE